MAATKRSASFWQSVRQLPSRTPLRVKLISTVLALVAVALVVISVAGLAFMSSYLSGQADNSIESLLSAQPSPQDLVAHVLNTGQVQPEQQVTVYWLPENGRRAVQIAQPFESLSPYGDKASGPMAPPRITPGARWLTSGHPTTVQATSGGGHWRVYAYSYTFSSSNFQPHPGTIVVGVDYSSAYRTIARLTGIDVIVSGLLLVVLAVVGIAVIRASLRPLADIERTAGAIAAGDLTRRVPERDPRTEVGRLGRSLNIMLSQIETAFRARSESEAAARRSEERMRRFVADASHELRTPLTAIRGFAEYYRYRGGVTDAPAEPSAPPQVATLGQTEPTAAKGSGQLARPDLDRIMRRVEKESARMGVLVDDMLLLARLDQQRPLERKTVDLLALAADAVHDARVVAPDRAINLTVGAGAALLVDGDEVRLRQVIGNLMSNALSHTPAGSPIDVRIRLGNMAEAEAATAAPDAVHAAFADANAATDQAAAVLEVTDYGPGLTKEQAEHAFERFYRADQARARHGTGLGLAIVAALVSAHGGAVWVLSEPGRGATFSIALPLTAEASEEAGQDREEVEDNDPAHDTAA